ncbi:MAG: MarR family transcriptional regulator [Eubacterium sp.]|nr:MarR family transcriptional regulator [Eubacterium sp.]
MELTSQDSLIVIGLHRIVNDMDRRTKQICKRYDLTLGQFAVLEALKSKGPLTVGEVKDLVLSTDGTIPVITGNLEKMGYIIRTQDETDKRRFILALTDQGRRMINQVYPENSEMLAGLLSVLSREEKKQLGLVIRKYKKNLQ